MTPTERTLRARIAAFALHSQGGTNTKPARLAFMARFEVEVDPDGTLPPEERSRRAHLARKAHFAGPALKSAKKLNLASDDHWYLFLGCLVQALRGQGPYPVLVILAEYGSAKSTGARVFRKLIDPNKSDLRSPPKDERDLRIAGTNSWIIEYDNISTIQEWLSTALCRLSTGGGMGTRELYSDDEERIFDGQRPSVLNGIEDVATRSDLMDRAVILEFLAIPEDERLTERVF